jgi:hypothetical protein
MIGSITVKTSADHELKAWPYYFDQVWRGIKPFEFRRDDRPFKAGDLVSLREWSQSVGYSGRVILARVTCIAGRDEPRLSVGIPPGFVILGLEIIGHSFGEPAHEGTT